MEAAAILTAVNAALALVEQLLPVLTKLKVSGQISAAQQEQIFNRYQQLKTNLDAEFSGPEWQVDPTGQA